MAIGYLPKMGGHGFQIKPGDGLLFTTVGGFTIPITVGYGFRITNGVLDGLFGEDLKVIMDGHH
jgi:hypothetical protein